MWSVDIAACAVCSLLVMGSSDPFAPPLALCISLLIGDVEVSQCSDRDCLGPVLIRLGCGLCAMDSLLNVSVPQFLPV